MNEIIQASGSSALAIRRDQSDWTNEQAMALLDMFSLSAAPHAVIQSYFHICQTTGLDPFKRQIHLIERGGKWTPQTSIDGFRIIRDRSGVYDGDETLWCGADGVWREAWIDPDQPPVACQFKLYVKGRSRPVVATALWREYVQTRGRDNQPTHMWAKMSAHMLAKVAEALAIRKAFPDDTGGLYTDDEMAQASNGEQSGGAPGRQRSPGIMDLETPPVAAPVETLAPAGVGGGFMDPVPAAAPDEGTNVVDAEVVDETPAPAPVPVAEPAPDEPEPVPEEAAVPMDMAPEPEPAPTHAHTWSSHLATALEDPQFDLSKLRLVYDEATAAGALGEPIPWASGATFDATVMAIKTNLEAGAPALQGIA